MNLIMKLAFSLCALLMASNSYARIEYLIDINEPAHHLARVEMTIPAGEKAITLAMPAWRTGNYKIINQANGIRDFSASGMNNQSLNWRRLDKSHWLVENPTQAKVSISYQVYANELGRRTRHIDSTHAFLDATAVFMYVPELMENIHLVHLKVPTGWKSYSGMTETAAHSFIAQNYHQLADSPIETGENQLFEFEVDNRKYQVVFWGKSNRDNQSIAEDLEKLVKTSQTIWQGYPYEKYVFMIHATSGAGGATEHMNSTVIQRERSLFADKDKYLDRFLRTAAHEIIHTWNVKAYRPEGLVPYDYQAENYSPLLWVAEGSTSYFQDHLLLASQLEKPKEYFEELSERIAEFKKKPGSEVQSIAQGSFEKWIAQGGDFADNHSVNIYSEGFMASWLLDFAILEDTNLKANYKTFHNRLYQKKQAKEMTYSYSVGEVQTLLQEISGKNYANWWQKNINSPLEIDFESMLEKVGLQFAPLKAKDFIVWTGFETKANEGLIELTRVFKNSPAWQAGLTTGDLLIAIDDYQVTPENLQTWLEQFKPNDEAKLIFFRQNRLQQTRIKFGQTTKKATPIEVVKSPSASQKAFFKAWTGVDLPEPSKTGNKSG